MKIAINRCYGGFGLSSEAKEMYAKFKNYELIRDNSFECFKDKNGKRIYEFDIARDDPNLIDVIETLGEKANGPSSKLKIIEINLNWDINDFDGMEKVIAVKREWF